MRFRVRLTLSLVGAIVLVAVLFAYFQVGAEESRLQSELALRAEVLGEGLAESAEPLVKRHAFLDLKDLVSQFSNRQPLAGVMIYDGEKLPVAGTPRLFPKFPTAPPAVLRAFESKTGQSEFVTAGTARMHIYALPLGESDPPLGALAVVHDASYIKAEVSRSWRRNFIRVFVQALLITLICWAIIRWSVIGPLVRTAKWMRDLRLGRYHEAPALPEEELFQPMAREVEHLAASLSLARAAAQQEARLRHAAEALWTAERLRVHVRTKLQGQPLFVVSNREPYIHVRRGKGIETLVPASGLVTAIEPILRACDGTWIAHGSGDADRETVSDRDRLRVPPEEPQYTLRRVWLSKEEEDGYYYGFANEGLWPLCHIAHTRPVFRTEDWAHYQGVNQKVAQAVLEETDGVEQPAVLVQDYHFALLPRLIKEKRPDARVAIFWHIPWPNPEAFAICPWQAEVLDGLLGADLVGLHVQAHCMNFLETVDRAIECRIEWDRFAVNRSGHFTLVRRFPISVAFCGADSNPRPPKSPPIVRAELFKALGIQASLMGVGVDRVDYTKGILERFRGIERFLEKYPAYVKRFSFVQIGAPSRDQIKRYQDLQKEIEAEVERINLRFQTPEWKPIVFLKRHHSHREIEPYYRAADVCLVTSLHDGMNLVAKEFVASREDEEGALILSHFTGASRELRDAILVNPYDTEQLAEAIRFALEMEPAERMRRMRELRRVVGENNIYRWAASLITELAEVRVERPAEFKVQ